MRSVSYPTTVFHYETEKDGHGWCGTTTHWTDKNTKTEESHTVLIRQTMPIGVINFWVDDITYGAWASGTIPGTGITERDLYWLSHLAMEAIRHRNAIGV
jgi:hypothetical protein